MTPKLPAEGQQNDGTPLDIMMPLRQPEFHVEPTDDPNTILFRGTLDYPDQTLSPTFGLNIIARFTDSDDASRLRESIAEVRASFTIFGTEPPTDPDVTEDDAQPSFVYDVDDPELSFEISLLDWDHDCAGVFGVLAVIDPPLPEGKHHHYRVDAPLAADDFCVDVDGGHFGDEARVTTSDGAHAYIKVGSSTKMQGRRVRGVWVTPRTRQIEYTFHGRFHRVPTN